MTFLIIRFELVGLVTSIAFAMEGHDVVGVDVDMDRVKKITQGEEPFCEAGLGKVLRTVLKRRRFTATSKTGETAGADIVFLCVGTPARPDGSMDDTFLKRAAEDLASVLRGDTGTVVVVKNTVAPGTAEEVVQPILEASGKPFGLAVNPEFLREGHAVEDALHPDRIV